MKTLKLFFLAVSSAAFLTTPALATEHTVGIGFGSTPDYEGSEDYQSIPMLMLKGNYDSGRSFSLMGPNLKVNVVPSRSYKFGPVLNYRQGRDDVDNNRVDAMKDIDDAFEAGVYGAIDINNVLLGAEILADVSDEHDGMLSKVSIGYRWRAAPALMIVPNLFTTYADSDYMDTYFGVNAGNRDTSGFPDFKADSGFKDYGVNLAVDYTPWEHWGIAGVLAYSVLLNDAKDSPIVDMVGDDKQMFFGLMGTYRWGK